jgi:hypothetical protein
MDISNQEYYLDPETWPEFMRTALLPVPPSGQAAWPDSAVTETPVNAPNASIPAGLLLTMMPRPPSQAPDQDGAAPLFMQSAMMPAPPSTPMLVPDTVGALSLADEASEAQAARLAAAMTTSSTG